MTSEERGIPIGISACLLGQNVRYDGGHAKDAYITDTLGVFFSFVPVCPEVECGMGVPRETLRLQGTPDRPCMVTTRTGVDHSERMHAWAGQRLDALDREDLCGYIFKKNSPSCGLFRVKVHPDKGPPVYQGMGLFARAFTDRFPRIPVEEEGRLNDPGLRENFIERVFVLKRWREHQRDGRSRAGLVDFHTRHKLLILSHDTETYRELGRWVADVKTRSIDEGYDQYEKRLLTAMGRQATIAKHTNVLQHLMGYFKKMLTSDEKQEMRDIIDRFRKGYLPLIVPVTLINHYVRKYGVSYLGDQVYLNPHPMELKLRNHA